MEMNSVHRAGLATILFENLSEDFGFVIGRANKRYTLWKYNKDNRNGVPYLIIKYVQVLSDKRRRVEQRFPDVFICEELRGERRMELQGYCRSKSGKWKPASAPKTIEDFMALPFGRFNGIPLREVSDWYWCKLANNGNLTWKDAWEDEFDFTELVINKCKELGCEEVAGQWYTNKQLENPKLWMYLANTCNKVEDPEKYEAYSELCRQHGMHRLAGKWFPFVAMDEEKPWMTVARQILPKVDAGEAFSFVAPFNGNNFWFGLPIEFLPEDKKDVYTYYGSSHFLLVTDKKGNRKAKRVKGKTIEVLDYEINEGADGKPFVLVNKFNII